MAHENNKEHHANVEFLSNVLKRFLNLFFHILFILVSTFFCVMLQMKSGKKHCSRCVIRDWQKQMAPRATLYGAFYPPLFGLLSAVALMHRVVVVSHEPSTTPAARRHPMLEALAHFRRPNNTRLWPEPGDEDDRLLNQLHHRHGDPNPGRQHLRHQPE